MATIRYGFIGLGLIGGSIARAIKEVQPDCEICAYDRDSNSLRLAKEAGVADVIFETGDEATFRAIGSCRFVFLCAPVSANDANLRLIRGHLGPDTILTDVGSVKSTIHRTIEAEGLSHRFIGGHPMAGSEKTGFVSANPLILENAYYILTPGKGVPEAALEELKALVESLRAIPMVLDASQHDYITAAVSHLPHVVAAALVNLVEQKDGDGLMKMIAAGGFKDITRIASSSPVMWQSICMTNAGDIVRLLDAYIATLATSRDQIAAGDGEGIYQFFEDSKNYRDSFSNIGSGPLKKAFVIYMDLKDEAGAIAKTATKLAEANISIKNIGIMHNREFQEGALRLELYDEAAEKLARELLEKDGYTIFR